MLHCYDNISLIINVCDESRINIARYVFMIFLKLLFPCILHVKATVYVMAASIY